MRDSLQQRLVPSAEAQTSVLKMMLPSGGDAVLIQIPNHSVMRPPAFITIWQACWTPEEAKLKHCEAEQQSCPNLPPLFLLAKAKVLLLLSVSLASLLPSLLKDKNEEEKNKQTTRVTLILRKRKDKQQLQWSMRSSGWHVSNAFHQAVCVCSAVFFYASRSPRQYSDIIDTSSSLPNKDRNVERRSMLKIQSHHLNKLLSGAKRTTFAHFLDSTNT